ncbi:hypothetical protein LCGC14_1267330 [marine sediment metagenome]|uniref:Uncharacterized protein n=1 Tax=marine sediment metagenome TaxID=412755 RepID=A0A0F9LK01_9ZZZZ
MTQGFWNNLPDVDRNAKGDLLTSTADGNPSTLTVGANGEFLSPRSSTANGLVWVHIQTYYGVVQTYEGVVQFKEA